MVWYERYSMSVDSLIKLVDIKGNYFTTDNMYSQRAILYPTLIIIFANTLLFSSVTVEVIVDAGESPGLSNQRLYPSVGFPSSYDRVVSG